MRLRKQQTKPFFFKSFYPREVKAFFIWEKKFKFETAFCRSTTFQDWFCLPFFVKRSKVVCSQFVASRFANLSPCEKRHFQIKYARELERGRKVSKYLDKKKIGKEKITMLSWSRQKLAPSILLPPIPRTPSGPRRETALPPVFLHLKDFPKANIGYTLLHKTKWNVF